MRAAISFLITGLLFGSLAVNSQAPGIHLSNSGSQVLMSAKDNTSKAPRKPWRGSGRNKILMESVDSTNPAV